MNVDNSPNAVFVYGTLRRGQLRESHWPHAPTKITVAYVKAALFDLGPYPAITVGSDVVMGELWSFPPDLIAPTLKVLDVIEGYIPGRPNNLYERVVVDAYCSSDFDDEHRTRAYIYRMNAEKLPKTALRIHETAMPGTRPPCCSWPERNEPPSETSQRPDPFPDDIAEG